MRFLDALSPRKTASPSSPLDGMKEQKRGVKAVDHIETLTDFTSDRARIAFAIDLARGGGDTNLYKALRHSLDALKGEGARRRKAIVVLTDGIDSDVRKEDRAATIQAKTAEEAIAAIKPDANATLASVLNLADAQGVTIYPLALPSGDLKRLADRATLSITPNKGTPPEDMKHLTQPTPQQAAIYTAAARVSTRSPHAPADVSTESAASKTWRDSTPKSPQRCARSTPSPISPPIPARATAAGAPSKSRSRAPN